MIKGLFSAGSMKMKNVVKETVENKDTVEKKRGINRFNGLTSKEWLPFQKSWFRYEGKEKLYRDNLRFFTSAALQSGVFYYGNEKTAFSNAIASLDIPIDSEKDIIQPLQFVIVDLLDEITEKTSLKKYGEIKEKIMRLVTSISNQLVDRRFIVVFIPNIQRKETYFPFAWDLAKSISTILSLKDEKIGCEEVETSIDGGKSFFTPSKKFFYCLYFRKDEHSNFNYKDDANNFFTNNEQRQKPSASSKLPSWFILKPQPRKKNEILHPAKYPEALVEMFINQFTKEGDTVFDPMSGTGSTQMAALKLNRNGYGTELSEFFADIAVNRCREFLEPVQKDFFHKTKLLDFKIIQKDARLVTTKDFPLFDYVITSPPYWDMLNMKGAENQAKRIEKGLQTNYSDSLEDLGNISDYNTFVNELCSIYFSVIQLMKPGSFMTIVVKNIKKKGRNYPFAWDLASELQKKLILLPEVFWCQDDISIAPYGYGNTWVSNTFHQYCLNFQKPL